MRKSDKIIIAICLIITLTSAGILIGFVANNNIPQKAYSAVENEIKEVFEYNHGQQKSEVVGLCMDGIKLNGHGKSDIKTFIIYASYIRRVTEGGRVTEKQYVTSFDVIRTNDGFLIIGE